MTHSPMFSAEATKGRRRFLGYGVSAALVLLAVAACSDLRSQTSASDREPHWERVEQSPARQSGKP